MELTNVIDNIAQDRFGFSAQDEELAYRRTRDTLARQYTSKVRAANATYAAKGFLAQPGSLHATIFEAQKDVLAKSVEASFKVMADRFDNHVELYRVGTEALLATDNLALNQYIAEDDAVKMRAENEAAVQVGVAETAITDLRTLIESRRNTLTLAENEILRGRLDVSAAQADVARARAGNEWQRVGLLEAKADAEATRVDSEAAKVEAERSQIAVLVKKAEADVAQLTALRTKSTAYRAEIGSRFTEAYADRSAIAAERQRVTAEGFTVDARTSLIEAEVDLDIAELDTSEERLRHRLALAILDTSLAKIKSGAAPRLVALEKTAVDAQIDREQSKVGGMKDGLVAEKEHLVGLKGLSEKAIEEENDLANLRTGLALSMNGFKQRAQEIEQASIAALDKAKSDLSTYLAKRKEDVRRLITEMRNDSQARIKDYENNAQITIADQRNDVAKELADAEEGSALFISDYRLRYSEAANRFATWVSNAEIEAGKAQAKANFTLDKSEE